MNAELQRVYDETPEEKPLSRLEPFKELILRWRRDGRSYPAICKLLQRQCGVQISKQCLRRYVLRRTRRPKTPKPPGEVDAQLAANQTLQAPQTIAPERSAAEKAALRMAAKACNHHSTNVRKQQHQELFVFDEDQPLTNKPEERKTPWQQQK